MLWSHSTGLYLNDRSLQFGDGLFETMLVCNGQVLLLDRHLARLRLGCERLAMPFNSAEIKLNVDRALTAARRQPSGERLVLRLHLSARGAARGYGRDDRLAPALHIGLHALPPSVQQQPVGSLKLRVCKIRLSSQPHLAGLKHANRLEQVLAQQEITDTPYDDGLLLDGGGRLIEAIASNLFVVLAGEVVTPVLSDCGVAGVFREWLFNALPEQAVGVRTLDLNDLDRASEVFIANSVHGPRAVQAIESNDSRWEFSGSVCFARVAAIWAAQHDRQFAQGSN